MMGVPPPKLRVSTTCQGDAMSPVSATAPPRTPEIRLTPALNKRAVAAAAETEGDVVINGQVWRFYSKIIAVCAFFSRMVLYEA
jgi:hypothetical protein